MHKKTTPEPIATQGTQEPEANKKVIIRQTPSPPVMTTGGGKGAPAANRLAVTVIALTGADFDIAHLPRSGSQALRPSTSRRSANHLVHKQVEIEDQERQAQDERHTEIGGGDLDTFARPLARHTFPD